MFTTMILDSMDSQSQYKKPTDAGTKLVLDIRVSEKRFFNHFNRTIFVLLVETLVYTNNAYNTVNLKKNIK